MQCQICTFITSSPNWYRLSSAHQSVLEACSCSYKITRNWPQRNFINYFLRSSKSMGSNFTKVNIKPQSTNSTEVCTHLWNILNCWQTVIQLQVTVASQDVNRSSNFFTALLKPKRFSWTYALFICKERVTILNLFQRRSGREMNTMDTPYRKHVYCFSQRCIEVSLQLNYYLTRASQYFATYNTHYANNVQYR